MKNVMQTDHRTISHKYALLLAFFWTIVNIRYCGIGYTQETISAASEVVFLLPLMLLFISFLYYAKLTRRELIISCVMLFFSILITVNSRQPTIIISTAAIIASIRVPIEFILDLDRKIKGAIIFCVATTNALQTDFLAKPFLGFNSPNLLAILFFCIMIETYYISNKKSASKKWMISYFTLLVVGHGITSSRTFLFVGILLLALSWVIQKAVYPKIYVLLVLLIVLVPLLLCVFYCSSDIIHTINDWLTGRLFMGNAYLSIYGVKLFGQPILYSTYFNGWRIVPDLYSVRMLTNFGLVFFGFTLFVNSWLANNYARFNDKESQLKIFLLFACLLYTIGESSAFNCFLNPSLLLIADFIQNSPFHPKLQNKVEALRSR